MNATIIEGTDGDDDLEGASGGDEILGLDGDDVLDGLEGDDLLDGGNDLLIGGAGDDVFIFKQGSGFDRIADFADGDKIDLTDFGFSNFSEINLVEDDGTVFIYLDEHTSVELTGIESVDDLSIYDFLM